jgi:hypothetical protein
MLHLKCEKTANIIHISNKKGMPGDSKFPKLYHIDLKPAVSRFNSDVQTVSNKLNYIQSDIF